MNTVRNWYFTIGEYRHIFSNAEAIELAEGIQAGKTAKYLRLDGEIYGNKKIEDGQRIRTAVIESIEYLDNIIQVKTLTDTYNLDRSEPCNCAGIANPNEIPIVLNKAHLIVVISATGAIATFRNKAKK